MAIRQSSNNVRFEEIRIEEECPISRAPFAREMGLLTSRGELLIGEILHRREIRRSCEPPRRGNLLLREKRPHETHGSSRPRRETWLLRFRENRGQ